MRRPLAVAGIAVALLGAATPAAAAPAGPVAVTMNRSSMAGLLGDRVPVQATVANTGSAATGRLVAHLDVVSLHEDVYVDPEDWSSQRTRYLPALTAGGSIAVPWTVKAVNSGHLVVYVTVLGAGRPVAGPALDVRVAAHTTIDAGGALPLALGVPALLGLALIGVRVRRPR